MIEYKLSLASSGAVKAPGYEDMLRFGYNKNCGVYRLRVTAADEWKGMKLRVFWHTPEGDPPASLVENGVVEVPAFVTAVSGEGRITFEGSDGTRTIPAPICVTAWRQIPAPKTVLCRRWVRLRGSSWWAGWKKSVQTPGKVPNRPGSR